MKLWRHLLFMAAAAPLWCIGAERTLLFVDDHDILYRPATQRLLHQPQRHSKNPLIVGVSIRIHLENAEVFAITLL